MLVLAATLTACASGPEREAERARTQQLVQTQVQLAAGYIERGQLDIARKHLDKALELDEKSPAANSLMGVLQWRLERYDEAERHFRRSLDTEPVDPDVQNNYAVFLCARGKHDEAVRLLEQVARNPAYRTPASAYENAGLCLLRKPAPAAAEQYFRKALERNPQQAKSLLSMARLSHNKGQNLQARGFMQRYLQAAPDSGESLLLAVHIERALRDQNAEASYALRLRNKFPNSPEAAQLERETRKTGKR
jgi:type IV pilus assembly protein PilF